MKWPMDPDLELLCGSFVLGRINCDLVTHPSSLAVPPGGIIHLYIPSHQGRLAKSWCKQMFVEFKVTEP